MTAAALWLAWAALAPAQEMPGPAAPRPLRIVAFGDSTTAPGAGVAHVWPERLEYLLGEWGIPAEVINAGVSGDTTVHARRRFQDDVLARRPDVVVIQFGLNDAVVTGVQGPDTPQVPLLLYEGNLRFFADALEKQGIAVVLMTPNPMVWQGRLPGYLSHPPYDVADPWGADTVVQRYARRVVRLARTRSLPLVAVHEHYRALGPDEAARLLPDGLHPNDAGHALVAGLVAAEVQGLVAAGRLPGPLPDPPLPPGYGLPVVDLAGQTARQVVVDRDPEQYLGQPATVLLDDGHTILCVYPEGHGRGPIRMKRSRDGGRSWSAPLPVPENWATNRGTPTIHRVADAAGRMRLILFSGLYPIRMAVSEDDGAVWSPLAPIGDYGGIVAMASVAPAGPGRYLGFFHDDGRFLAGGGPDAGFRVCQVESTDGGLSWGAPRVIARHPKAELCEPGLVMSPDGRRMALLLRDDSHTRNSFVVFSSDQGATWSPPRELPAALTGDRHVARYGPGGRLFVSFRDTARESPTQGDWCGWVGTFKDVAEGREGQYRVRLMDNRRRWDCGYAGVEVLPDGTFVCTSYGHWEEGAEPYLVSVRFTLAELDALLAAQRRRR